MWQVKQRIERSLIAPIRSSAAGDPAVSVPTGVLLHGPSGCGASFIARCLAEEIASVPVPVTLIEDFDDLAGCGPDMADRVFGADGGRAIVVATSHAPWDLPDWMFGRGRVDRMVFVAPPDWDARRFRFWQLATAHHRDLDLIEPLLEATEAWSGSDIDDLVADDALPWADAGQLVAEVAQRRPAVFDWLTAARSMAVYEQRGAMIDDLTSYLQRFRLY